MKAFMISSMQSGAGKTVTSCALMAALQKRGLQVQAFKSGPDYIDPMFHSRVLGVESRNLDLFLQGEKRVLQSFRSARGDIGIVEGAMGYYDGFSGSTDKSAWELATILGIPVILVLRPKGIDVSLAALLKGMQSFRKESRIAGVILSDCTENLAEHFRTLLERECKLPVLGYLPPMEEARIESRHLGLLTAGEIADFRERFDCLAKQAERSIDLERLLELAAEGKQNKEEKRTERNLSASVDNQMLTPHCRIAVARDEAFCFRYADSEDALRNAGAELLYFSPLHDACLPEADGLWLCGGYPELYAEQLSENVEMRRAIRDKVRKGLPTVAECGGFLYLQESLEDSEGKPYPMCGVFSGMGFRTGHLQRFGYLTICAEEDSMLFKAGEQIPAHEFHYWDSTENGSDLTAGKADGRSWHFGYVSESMYAAFPHLHFGGELPLAKRFTEACVR